MAKPTEFSSVQDWVNAAFTPKISNAKSLNEVTLSKVGKVLLKVHPTSPAGLLGLQAGDILYRLNSGSVNIDILEKTFQPRRFNFPNRFEFFRPTTKQKITIKGPCFPFGTSFGQTHETFAQHLRTGDPDPSDTSQYWSTGKTEKLAALLPAFEIFNIRIINHKGAPFFGKMPESLPYNTELANEDLLWPGYYAWMALCAAHAGQWDRASFILDTVEDHFDRTGDSGMMNMFAAMAYTRSMLNEQNGYLEKAVKHMHRAIEMSPETEILYERLSRLTNTNISLPKSPLLGVKLAYDFPKEDPKKQFKQTDGRVSLHESLARLSPGEFILTTIMSSYRTNGPYVEGFQRAHLPLAKLRTIFREVHVITSWKKETSRDLTLPIMEETLRKSGVNICLLFDQDQTLSEQLELISAPTNLIIDHTGTVIATGWLGGDAVLWDALQHHANG